MNENYQGVIVFDLEGTLIDSDKGAPYHGVKELLAELSSDYLLLLWSLSYRAAALRLLQDEKLVGYFWEFFCADDQQRKPHPSSQLEQFIAPYQRRFMVGDNPVDYRAAQLIGAHFIAAGWNPSLAQNFGHSSPPIELCHLPLSVKELIKVIKRTDQI